MNTDLKRILAGTNFTRDAAYDFDQNERNEQALRKLEAYIEKKLERRRSLIEELNGAFNSAVLGRQAFSLVDETVRFIEAKLDERAADGEYMTQEEAKRHIGELSAVSGIVKGRPKKQCRYGFEKCTKCDKGQP
jgi:hypothetical protein